MTDGAATAGGAGRAVESIFGMIATFKETSGDVSHYELTLSNAEPTPVRLTLAVKEPTGALAVMVPSPIMLTGGQVQRLPVEVRQLRPMPGGARGHAGSRSVLSGTMARGSEV